jgi:hypothetical protein
VKLRRVPQMSIYKLLTVCHFLGYSKIYLIGVENTFFRGVKLTDSGQIVEGSTHYDPNYKTDPDMTHNFPSGITDYFHWISQLFYSFHRYFPSDWIVNLDSNSLIDAIPRIAEDHELALLIKPERFTAS